MYRKHVLQTSTSKFLRSKDSQRLNYFLEVTYVLKEPHKKFQDTGELFKPILSRQNIYDFPPGSKKDSSGNAN